MLCAIARLDEEATRMLISFQFLVSVFVVCLKPLYGHITIAAYTGTEEARFIRSCRESLAGFSAFTVTYSKIEVLEETSIIVATPVKTGSLKEIHQIIAKQFEDSLDEWTKQDRWHPHTTLLFRPDSDLHAICRKLSAHFVSFPARVCSRESSRVFPSVYELIARLELSGVRSM